MSPKKSPEKKSAMKRGAMGKADLEGFLAALRQSFQVYVPVREEGGVNLGELREGMSPVLDYGRLQRPVKGLFFPQWEPILQYQDGVPRSVPAPGGRKVLFGARPCDARALRHLDAVLGEGTFRDPSYVTRRADTVVVSLACTAPGEGCFCASLGGGPFDQTGSDVLVFADAEALLFQASSEAGADLMASFAEHFGEASKAIVERRERAAAAAAAAVAGAGGPQASRLQPAKLDTAGLAEKLGSLRDQGFWEALARRCLGCGACAYLCPTCHCFGFAEERCLEGTRRYRNWDACAFALFTREASGHNPRSSQGQRVRQRVMHKFCYSVENYGQAFCVGCGRCVSNCPANIDLREIVSEVAG